MGGGAPARRHSVTCTHSLCASLLRHLLRTPPMMFVYKSTTHALSRIKFHCGYHHSQITFNYAYTYHTRAHKHKH
jgi:hypothetical protein